MTLTIATTSLLVASTISLAWAFWTFINRSHPGLTELRGQDETQATDSVGNCLTRVEREVGTLPKEWVVLRNQNVSLMVHDPDVEFISKYGYDKKMWWSWEIMDNIEKAVGPYTSGMFLEIGTNIGTVSTHFASKGVPVLTVEANPTNYVRIRASLCLNDFSAPFVAVHRAATTHDNGPALYIDEWPYNLGGSFTNPNGKDGMAKVQPVTVDSLAYGEGSMTNYDYNDLNVKTLPVWAMKVDCEGCEGAALVSAKRLLRDPKRHPIAIHVEITPQYLKSRGGGVGVDELYAELKSAGYTSHFDCPGFADETFNSTYMDEYVAKHMQWDCMFTKKRETTHQQRDSGT